MYIDPTVYSSRPSRPSRPVTPQEDAIYNRLEELKLPFIRLDHDHADTMEDCRRIESLLGARICKNLFLCNRQQTDYYLLMMHGEKPFKTKYLSAQLGVSRLSFAGEEAMSELLHTVPGSVSALELLFDEQHRIRLVIDEPLFEDAFISGHPGFSTSTVRLTHADFLTYIASTGHEPAIIRLPDEE